MTTTGKACSLTAAISLIGSLVGGVNAATVIVPEATVTTIGSDAFGHHGINIAATNSFGAFTQGAGTVTANAGDTVELKILPMNGMVFQLNTTLLSSAVVSANFELLNSRFPPSSSNNGLRSVTFNNVQGGVAPSIVPITNSNNSAFATPPPNMPTGFFGQVGAFASHSNGQPFSFGSGVITFESITVQIPNVTELNWDDQSLDYLSVYFGNSDNSPVGFSMVGVPEPSSALLFAFGMLGVLSHRRRIR